MKLKKVLAALLALMFVLSCVPLAANAATKSMVPKELYVGEKNKTDHNLIDRLDSSNGIVKVVAIDTETNAYYTVTKEDGVGYVLTFYNNYNMSELVDNYGRYCGLYCDGDLTIRIAGDVTFDANKFALAAKVTDVIGWVVEGTLTVEGATTGARLTICGSKAKSEYDAGSIGIYAKTLKLHRLTVNACGGYAAVKADDTIVLGGATLYANTAAEMTSETGADLFKYGIDAYDVIQVGGTLKANGVHNVDGFFFKGGDQEFDTRAVIYLKDFNFKEESFSGKYNDTFKLFKNYKDIPECLDVYLDSSEMGRRIVVISGNDLKMYRRGAGSIAVSVQCGSETLTLDTADVYCTVKWYQWIPYIFDVIFHGV